jgi:hypothetical protein
MTFTNQSTRVRKLPRTCTGHGVASGHTLLCTGAARLVLRSLHEMPWHDLRYAERQRLGRVLARLENDVALARTILSTTPPSPAPACHPRSATQAVMPPR